MIGSIFGQNCGIFFYKQDGLYKNVFVYMPWCTKFLYQSIIILFQFSLFGDFLFSTCSWFSFSERKEKNHSCQALSKISDVSRNMLRAQCICLVKRSVSVSSVTGHNKAISYCKRHRDWAIHPHWDYSLHWTCTFHLLPDPPMRNPSGRGLLFCVWC